MIRDSVQSVDPRVPVFDVRTMDERLAFTLSRQRFYAAAAAFLGALALVLALVGVLRSRVVRPAPAHARA